MVLRGVIILAGVVGSAQAATYSLERLPVDPASPLTEAASLAPIVGLHVGSMLAFKANCVNVDIQGIEDGRGVTSTPGSVYALNAETSYVPLGPDEPARLFFLQHDGTKPFPFRAQRFDWIIAEHFIEHLSYPDAVAFLREARRMLSVGGTLRLSTPDLAIYAAAFFDPKQRFFQEHYEVMTGTPEMASNKVAQKSCSGRY